MQFDLKQAKDGQYYFHVRSDNGTHLISSHLYSTKASAENGIASVENNHNKPEQYEIRTQTNGMFYFVLKASNGQVIAISYSCSNQNNLKETMDILIGGE